MMKKIVFITTGGTISMKYAHESGGVVPSLFGKQLLDSIRFENKEDLAIEVNDFCHVGGGELTPSIYLELSNLIKRYLAREDKPDGFVISQGTDTMEETSFLLDLLLDIPEPVVITGSMRNASEMSYDGTVNLYHSIQVAGSAKAMNKGVMVCMNNNIYAAMDVQKTHAFNVASIAAPGRGPIGSILGDRMIFYYQPLLRQHCEPEHLNHNVFIVKTGIGELPLPSVLPDYDGFVIEGTGLGNGQAWMEPWIKEQLAQKKPVIITTRCAEGWVDSMYAYPGSIGRLLEAGVIPGHGVNGVKARIKLIAALGSKMTNKEIKSFFEWDL
ncbi:Asparaginase [Syntrophobotulus glycolicus DSM 8271]|uniref:Asparaginase n=1 Tax=Syntrophobotulus glycolicus (strain DSM 8271 / FlGlyR) TaxID=645991 RepID=F0SW11_SYNGF|nr:asparaginase [Syntrophobotulus glycolicus]ADY56795.1 Asparaginase [Syntrophobotulus glycolicus DSM 8271]